MVDGSQDSVIAPAPEDVEPVPAVTEPVDYRVVEIREDGTPIVGLPDGRVVPATLADGVKVKKRDKVEFTSDGTDKDDAPLAVVITGVVS